MTYKTRVTKVQTLCIQREEAATKNKKAKNKVQNRNNKECEHNKCMKFEFVLKIGLHV